MIFLLCWALVIFSTIEKSSASLTDENAEYKTSHSRIIYSVFSFLENYFKRGRKEPILFLFTRTRVVSRTDAAQQVCRSDSMQSITEKCLHCFFPYGNTEKCRVFSWQTGCWRPCASATFLNRPKLFSVALRSFLFFVFSCFRCWCCVSCVGAELNI